MSEPHPHLVYTLVPAEPGDDAGSEEGHFDPVRPARPHPTALSTNHQHPCVGGGLQQWEVSQSNNSLKNVSMAMAAEDYGNYGLKLQAGILCPRTAEEL